MKLFWRKGHLFIWIFILVVITSSTIEVTARFGGRGRGGSRGRGRGHGSGRGGHGGGGGGHSGGGGGHSGGGGGHGGSGGIHTTSANGGIHSGSSDSHSSPVHRPIYHPSPVHHPQTHTASKSTSTSQQTGDVHKPLLGTPHRTIPPVTLSKDFTKIESKPVIHNPYQKTPNQVPGQHTYGSTAMSEPFVPSRGVILLPQEQERRGIGQSIKEALVYSTVDHGVNRVIHGPSYYYYHHHHHGYDETTTTSTTTTEAPLISPFYDPFDNILTDVPDDPISAMIQKVRDQIERNTKDFDDMLGIRIPPFETFLPTTTTTTTTTTEAPLPEIEYYISQSVLENLTETLFNKDEPELYKYVTLNSKLRMINDSSNDAASESLFLINSRMYNVSMVSALVNLYDNYEINSTLKENVTREVKQQEDFLLDTILSTDVMITTVKWLIEKGYVDPDDFEVKDTLRRIWFTRIEGSTSAFERIFAAEYYDGPSILGGHNWIYFAHEESLGRINCTGFTEKVNLGNNAALIKVNFQMGNVLRPNVTMLVGTSPELEIALYTICFYARPNDICQVSFGGVKFSIYTHSYRYFGNDLIDLGVIVF